MFKILMLLCALIGSAPLKAKEIWDWNTLLPESAKQFVDPFFSFSPEQRYNLMTIMEYQQADASDKDSKSYIDALMRFSGENIEILTLIKQREEIVTKHAKALQSINEALIGQDGRLPGYIVPLEFDNNIVTQFLLVPTAGACIHTPPPPANQIVLVHYPKGFEFEGLYTPIWIEGTLQSEASNRSVQLSDGETTISTSYQMVANKIEPYQ
ncbi:DUF3299 domain-containing protein [Vibrio sp. 10N.286.49.B1]|uniref:DUF3299 domain-containing protein n=1 Tax=unclassified Vibrio TaxID=2614977 RepID=UPI001056BBF9|nr:MULTISPECIES: DUF3299 domain-containing protein [unclassified Vibrio]